ncbi:uncharacterized protein LOC131672631 [Phymastichus coffea]|uniref:uncharacterized protein LOC131672631 n=1 Tax=Phymastichus coffea TaxID=108790 RepID=UPI00273AD552|nr:uncharacterized protein LOC131672631 [Phymastichus coffea]
MHSATRAYATVLLLASCELLLAAVVLPRPPASSSPSSSSSNFIPLDEAIADALDKSYHGKALYQQNTNVEKPDTQDYRLLEIDLNDAENIETLDLHDLMQAVLANQPHPRRLDIDVDDSSESNLTHPHPEVVPHSILGVRDVGLGLNQRLFESHRQHFLLGPSQPTKNIGDEKMYYLKSSRPKVYVNFRGRTGNFRQDVGDSKVTMRFEPASFLRATQPYQMEKKTKAPKFPPKKYDRLIHGDGNKIYDSARASTSTTTTENTMVTSSELPKQIPAPPSRIPSRSPIVQTTPVQRFRRTDILPGYAFAEA